MTLRELIDNHLQKLSPKEEDLCSQAVRYALLGGGKRFRPSLTLAVAQALQGSIEDALSPACAVEMVHVYSMIHDDLPCMDDDSLRRGKPTVHCAFSEGIAVLAGDWLLTHAFQVIAECSHLDAGKRLALTEILARRAGGEGMIGGQVLDLASEGKSISLEQLEKIHRRKTGALITAAVEFGCIVATGKVDSAFRSFGEHLGLAFQIVDDILDVTHGDEKHGRASDVENSKSTYVSLLGLDGARAAAADYFAKAEAALPVTSDELSKYTAQRT